MVSSCWLRALLLLPDGSYRKLCKSVVEGKSKAGGEKERRKEGRNDMNLGMKKRSSQLADSGWLASDGCLALPRREEKRREGESSKKTAFWLAS